MWVGVYETPISIVQQWRLVSGAVLCCVQYVHCTVNINVFTVHLCPVCIYMSDIGGMYSGGMYIECENVCIIRMCACVFFIYCVYTHTYKVGAQVNCVFSVHTGEL